MPNEAIENIEFSLTMDIACCSCGFAGVLVEKITDASPYVRGIDPLKSAKSALLKEAEAFGWIFKNGKSFCCDECAEDI